MAQPIPDMYPNYAKALLDDLSDQQFKLRKLTKMQERAEDKKGLLKKYILKTKLEIESIEHEIDQIIRLAFFPYHDVPILDLLTDERYNQGPIPGTIPPEGDS